MPPPLKEETPMLPSLLVGLYTLHSLSLPNFLLSLLYSLYQSLSTPCLPLATLAAISLVSFLHS